MNQTGSRSCGSGWGNSKQTIRNTLQKAAQRKVRPAERQQKRKWLAPEGRPGHLPQATGRTWRAFPGLQHRGHHGAGRGVGAKFRSSTSLARASLALDPSLRSAPPGAPPHRGPSTAAACAPGWLHAREPPPRLGTWLLSFQSPCPLSTRSSSVSLPSQPSPLHSRWKNFSTWSVSQGSRVWFYTPL